MDGEIDLETQKLKLTESYVEKFNPTLNKVPGIQLIVRSQSLVNQ
jgi:hypothetical protein